ncbi:hypothetical protein L6255_02310 [Candidatus Parcubacteria bacterium]|nr:hypothetical protein [Patescibacteria group bacterium]MBU4381218.1 hypothetical protein [Patescibacteria group bacterium]MCG2689250.1 hypothetical protein [Candidatus Parcubacteria bacterium]
MTLEKRDLIIIILTIICLGVWVLYDATKPEITATDVLQIYQDEIAPLDPKLVYPN